MTTHQDAVLARVVGGAIDGRLRVLRFRQRQFISLHKAIVKHWTAFLQAIQEDDGCSEQEAKIILGSALIDLRNHYDGLDLKSDLDQEYALANNRSNEYKCVPFGIAYIIPDSFTVLFSVLSALSAALEAGTCVIIELENTLRKTPALLRQVLSDSLDKDAFGVISSRAPAEFLAKCVVVDQTGETSFLSAERVLTSTTHRNVAVLDRTGDVVLAAKEIAASCMTFKGASRYAVDLVFVNEFVSDKFTAAVNQEMSKAAKAIGLAHDTSRSGKGRVSTGITAKDVLEGEIASGRVKSIVGALGGGVVQVVDRDSTLMTSKRSLPIVVICKITSLDDAIDAVNTGAEYTNSIAALYLFSGAREAKYLSQYINSHVSYVNHIPAQLTVGPTVPIGYATDLRRRYTRAMFETPSPQIVPDPKSHLVSTVFQKSDFIGMVGQRPLKPTGQAPSGGGDFFEQGIMLGALVYLLPIVSMATFGVGYTMWKAYQKLSM